MKVIVAHNYYTEAGGEDVVFHSEMDLLRQAGISVVRFVVHNETVKTMGRLALFANTFWNRSVYHDLRRLIRSERADLVHFHNTFPLISPAAYYAAHAEGAAVVQTLHNYRLLCPGSNFYREGKVCTDCLGSAIPWRGAVRGCYRGSRAISTVSAATVTAHRAIGTWRRRVDAYVALTEFAKQKFVTGGIPADRIFVKPNFVSPDPRLRTGGGNYAVFVGRFWKEKGIHTILDAWRHVGEHLPLRIVGDGPMVEQVREAAAGNPAITWLGRRSVEEVYDIIGNAMVLVLPSDCFETFGRVAVEAFALGTPVIAAGHGAPGDVVGNDGRLGLLFEPGDAEDLARVVLQLVSMPDERRAMRDAVRREYESKYTGERNMAFFRSIYDHALSSFHQDPKREPLTWMSAGRAT